MNFALLLLVQLITYLALMLWQEYAGMLLAIILGAICLSLWLLSYLVEWIEPSRVTKKYFAYMLAGWLAPFLALAVFIALRGGQIGWLS